MLQHKILWFVILFIEVCLNIYGQEKSKSHSGFRDSLDNAIDISDWLITKKGVLLVPSIITEPAVDYGASVAALFFHSSYTEKRGPPSISGVMGGATLNSTWLGGIFHAGYWKRDRIRYLGALARTDMNLGFYGSGNAGLIGLESVNLNLDAWLLVQQIKLGAAGDVVKMTLSDGSAYPLKGRLNFADRQVDPSTGAMTLEAQFRNSDNILRPGQDSFLMRTRDIL